MTAAMTEPKVVQYTDFITPTSYESSIIAGAWHNKFTHELYIQLRTMTGLIGYAGVSNLEWQEFINSTSLGSHYNKYIKSRYRGIDGNVAMVSTNRNAPVTSKYTVTVEVSATSVEEVEEMFGAGIVVKAVTKHY